MDYFGSRPDGDEALNFLAGRSAMARMIRARDWSDHAFGAPTTWPQSLRSALSICLHSTFPTAIYWGPELRLLYNDAWAPIPGPRHPHALGAPAREVWADIWHVIAPQFERLLSTGEGEFLENQMLPMRRFGAPEETFWSYSFTPIRGEDGSIAGVFNSGSETTASVLAQRQMAFLLELGETLRAVGEPEELRLAAATLLGRHLRVDRVGFLEVVGDDLRVTSEWTAPGVRPFAPLLGLSAFGARIGEALRAGRVVRIDDAEHDPLVGDPEARRAFRAVGAAAAVAVPRMENGRLAGAAYLHSTASRDWNDFDITTIEQLLDRTSVWMERRRAEERERIMMREMDHRARNVLAVAQSVVRLTDAPEVAVFRRKVEARIGALSRAHTLLAARRWEPIDIRNVLDQELEPYAGDRAGRLRVVGPPVMLPPDLAQSFELVLHELATNAAKHGSLSAPGGTLDVGWRAEAGTFLLDWTERLPEPLKAPAAAPRRGFGSELLRRVVEAQLGGRIEVDLGDYGLRCRIALPFGEPGEPARPSGAARTGTLRRVLIAEDEALVAMDVEDMVRTLGFGIFGAFGSLADAMRALDADDAPPDLAILDGNLHGESVLPLAERLHALGVPLIFASGYGSISGLSPELETATQLGKPFSETALAEAIRNAGLALPPGRNRD